MPNPVAILALPDSSLGAALIPRLNSLGVSARVLSLNAPLAGGAVTIRPGSVTWEGFELLSAGAILVERPEIAWPQPLCLDDLSADRDEQRRVIAAEREARSLLLSAITIAAEHRPVVNPPEAAHLVAAPAMALDRVHRAGVAVHPWRLEPAPRADAAAGRVFVDSVGRDRWHDPALSGAGEPALVFDAVEGCVDVFLVVGDRAAAALRYLDARAWAQAATGAAASLVPPDSAAAPQVPLDPAAALVAVRAVSALKLEVAAVSVVTTAGPPDAVGAQGASPAPSVLLIDAAPDLVSWDRAAAGAVLPRLCERLVALASHPQGGTP